jgi:hypothetical protein
MEMAITFEMGISHPVLGLKRGGSLFVVHSRGLHSRVLDYQQEYGYVDRELLLLRYSYADSQSQD